MLKSYRYLIVWQKAIYYLKPLKLVKCLMDYEEASRKGSYKNPEP